MNPAVVFGFDPGREQPVELQQCAAVIGARRSQLIGAGVDDFDEELLAHGAEEPFDLPPALGAVRGGMH
jgi:hypothetical protein